VLYLDLVAGLEGPTHTRVSASRGGEDCESPVCVQERHKGASRDLYRGQEASFATREEMAV